MRPFVVVPVPGAQPAPAPIAGAQLVVPSGAGVAPGVVFVGVNTPGAGAVVTPVVPAGEITVGVVVGIDAPGVVVVVVPGVTTPAGAPGVATVPPAVPVAPAASAAKADKPPQSATTQPVASRRITRPLFDICFMTALLSAVDASAGTAVLKKTPGVARRCPQMQSARPKARAPLHVSLPT